MRTCAHWLAAGLALAGCGESSVLRGEVSVYIADYADGHSETQRFLVLPDGSERRLWFAKAPPRLQPGDLVEVRGQAAGDGIAVESFAIADRPRALPLAGQPPRTPKRVAFVLVETGGGLSLTADAARARIFADTTPPDTSLGAYYNEVSFGMQGITGDVIGPLNYTMNGCDTRSLATALRPMISGTYDHYMWYFPQSSSCGWSGLANVGTPMRPSRDTWYNGSSGCVVLAQEIGHNFGEMHSSSLDCGTASFSTTPESSCTPSEYGDPYDVMGHGCYHWTTFHKQHMGWFGGCNVVTANAGGTFDLFPMETPCDAIQMVRVPMPAARQATSAQGDAVQLAYYTIEYRQPFGAFERASSTLYQGVLVHAAPDFPTQGETGDYHFLLDMTPATSSFNDAALAVGQTFTDPAGGVSITLMAADGAKATVQVTVASGSGGNVCLDGSSVQPPGPQGCTSGSGGAGGAGGSGGTGGIGGSGGAGGDPGSGGASGTGGGSGGTSGGTSGGEGGGDPGTGTGSSSGVVGGCQAVPGGSDCAPLGLLLVAVGFALSRRRRGAA